MTLIIFILDLYIAVHAVWWFLQETNRAQSHSFTPFLSRVCSPYCRLFRKVELRICGNDAAVAVPVLSLAAIRILLSIPF